MKDIVNTNQDKLTATSKWFRNYKDVSRILNPFVKGIVKYQNNPFKLGNKQGDRGAYTIVDNNVPLDKGL